MSTAKSQIVGTIELDGPLASDACSNNAWLDREYDRLACKMNCTQGTAFSYQLTDLIRLPWSDHDVVATKTRQAQVTQGQQLIDAAALKRELDLQARRLLGSGGWKRKAR